MERVAFLIEATNERFSCLLNPESLVMRRTAGIQSRRTGAGQVTGTGLSDDPLLYTGGGRTELDLELLFDVSLAPPAAQIKDVRQLTAPLWALAENAGRENDYKRPPIVRFIWGKLWNIPGVVTAVTERLEQFTETGAPQRSWLKMRFLRVGEPPPEAAPEAPSAWKLMPGHTLEYLPGPGSPTAFQALPSTVPTMEPPPEETKVHEVVAGERPDGIAHHYYGSALVWRLVAQFNFINDPLHMEAGLVLRIPSMEWLRRWL